MCRRWRVSRLWGLLLRGEEDVLVCWSGRETKKKKSNSTSNDTQHGTNGLQYSWLMRATTTMCSSFLLFFFFQHLLYLCMLLSLGNLATDGGGVSHLWLTARRLRTCPLHPFFFPFLYAEYQCMSHTLWNFISSFKAVFVCVLSGSSRTRVMSVGAEVQGLGWWHRGVENSLESK